MHNVTLRYLLATTVAVEKQGVLQILSLFVALDIQHAMRRIIFSYVACPIVGYFPTFRVNDTI